MLTAIRHGLLHLFYPRLCEGCSRPLLAVEEVLCIECALGLPETDYHHIPGNETELRLAGRIPFVRATSYAYFTADGLLQHLLHGLKYNDRSEIGLFLGRRLGYALRDADWIKSVDAIVPVPLHPSKEAARGYNQSLLIARGMGEVLGIAVVANALLRTRATESQTRKSRTGRVNNMADAFAVPDPALIAGRHVLLCDDVLTTGATMEACAQALLAAGNVKISLATIGIAVS